MNLIYTYQLRPSKAQRTALDAILEAQRQLYNKCLGWKQMAWDTCKANVSYFDFCKWQPKNACNVLPANLNRSTLQRLERSFNNFYRRCKAGAIPGYPRFKGKDWFTSFGFAEFSGIRLKNNKLYFKGVGGGLRVNLHRPLPPGAKICCCVFKKTANTWNISFQLKLLDTLPKPVRSRVGIDVGLTTLAALSTGEKIDNIRPDKTLQAEKRRQQRAVSRKVKGSKSRGKAKAQVARTYAKIANIRSTYLHQVSAHLVKSYDLIAVEKLNIKGLCQSTLARHVHDAAWATLFHHLCYKAAKAGGKVVEVNARNTTQECSGCGEIVRKELSDRTHSCPHCGLTLCRDVNAARVILHRAVVSPGGLNLNNGLDALGNVCFEQSN